MAQDNRTEFEEWAQKPPREWSVERFPDDLNSAWPRHYKDYHVQCAWETFQEFSEPEGYPHCDSCKEPLDYMPWHYSEGDNRHLHACDECWDKRQSQGVPEWIQQLKCLAEAATPGPWHGGHGACIDSVAVDYRDERGNMTGESFTKAGGHAKAICQARPTKWRDIGQVVKDMKFIAAANPRAILDVIALLSTPAAPQAVEIEPDLFWDCDNVEDSGQDSAYDLASYCAQDMPANDTMLVDVMCAKRLPNRQMLIWIDDDDNVQWEWISPQPPEQGDGV